MIESERAGLILEELKSLRSALDRLSHLCIGLCQRERDLFQDVLDGLIKAHNAAPNDDETVNRQVCSAYWKLNDWAEEVSSNAICHSDGSAISECIIERVCNSPHAFLSQSDIVGPERASAGLRQVFCRDLLVLQRLALADWKALSNRYLGVGSELQDEEAMRSIPPPTSVVETDQFKRELKLKELLRTVKRWDEHWADIARFVRGAGLPPFRYARAFYVHANGDQIELAPIGEFASFPLAWFEGNKDRTDVILHNTRQLIAGKRAQNILIWGPRGGGKSSLIRGLIDLYYDQGLRGIEVAPDDYCHLRKVFDIVRSRREFFICVLDNISLARGDNNLHHLSRVLDGGLESLPTNVAFYATSNFKDLVDREGATMQGLGRLQMETAGEAAKTSTGIRPEFYDPQQNQRIDELRALDDRFALKAFIDLPRRDEYQNMVLSYARRAKINVPDDELLSQFNVWCMRHNHDLVGGRTARDFIQYLANTSVE